MSKIMKTSTELTLKVLREIIRNPGKPLALIRKRTDISHSYITNMKDLMIEKGLMIEKKVGRCLTFELTNEGVKVFEILQELEGLVDFIK